MRVNESNVHLVRSGYLRRTPKELPVLSRWIPGSDVAAPLAKKLDIILYSREQIVAERVAQGDEVSDDAHGNPWAVAMLMSASHGAEVASNWEA